MDARSQQAWTLQTLIGELAARGDHPAVQWIEHEAVASLSSAELADLSLRLAAGLMGDGVAPGEAVLLLAPNRPEWIVARLAIGAIGAVAVALDDLSHEDEIAAALKGIETRLAFTVAKHVPVLRRLSGERLKIVVLDGDTSPERKTEGTTPLREMLGPALPADRAPLPTVSGSAEAMIVYTSGTTGTPKSFALTYDRIWANLRALVDERLVGPDDRVLMPLPLHHVYPLVVGLFTPLHGGAAVVLTESAGGPDILKALRLARPTAIVGVPRLYAAIVAGLEARVAAKGALASALFRRALDVSAWAKRALNLDLGRGLFRSLRARIGSDLRLLVSGGARLDPDILWPLVGLGFEVRSGYGLAETASIFTGNVPRRERLGSEGKAFGDGEMRIDAPAEDGVGEIQLRGPNVFTGYRDNPDADRNAFAADADGNKWFRTGDLGRIDADGFLTVTGRTKEILVLGGGKKVNPEALEKMYGANPAIQEIAVLERDGALVALVLPDFKGIRETSGARPEDAVRIALGESARALASYQRVAGFALTREPLPRTRLGKLRRFLLPDLYDRTLRGVVREKPVAPTPEDQALIDRPRAHQIWELLRRRYPHAVVAPGANLSLDLGIDSLEWVSLLLVIEQRLGWRLPEDDVGRLETVRDLLTLAETAQAPHAPLVSEPVDTRWIEPTGPVLAALGTVIYGINRLLFAALFRLSSSGRDNIPPTGSFVVVANHVSDLDPPAVAAALRLSQLRRIYWGASVQRLFTRRWLDPLWRANHVMPVDERLPSSTFALPLAVLKRGNGLVWFPEGWRSPDGRLQRFQPGKSVV